MDKRGKSAANLRNLFRKYWLEALLLVLVVVVTVVLVMESSPAPGLGSQSFPRFYVTIAKTWRCAGHGSAVERIVN